MLNTINKISLISQLRVVSCLLVGTVLNNQMYHLWVEDLAGIQNVFHVDRLDITQLNVHNEHLNF